ncbi:MAG: serine hydrolase [Puia sp.]|nr:serine hydrolase [Puia sp.]
MRGPTIKKTLIRLGIFLLLLSPSLLLRAQEYPDYNWQYAQNPGGAGWDKGQLEKLRKFLIDSTSITGFLIIHREKIVFEYGDIRENSYIASCRKSVLSMIYGEHVKSGEIDLNKSLKDLGIDDVGGLLPVEKEATVKDIISARSGVFHPASYLGDYLAYAPKRGSVMPGKYWLYSNWDFNMAGYIFEKETRRNIYDEVERILVLPLHMQDWNRSLQHKEGDTTRSFYEAYPMWFSTRDMARIGQLMLNKGEWGGRQIIDEDWIREMLTPRTSFTEINDHIPDYRNTGYDFGYGYMWWLWQHTDDDRFKGAYSALGNMGQCISVFPAIDAVIVYKTKSAYERETPFLARYRVLTLAVKSLDSK